MKMGSGREKTGYFPFFQDLSVYCGLLVILHRLVVRCVENVQSRRRVSKISRYENCERRGDYWRETERSAVDY